MKSYILLLIICCLQFNVNARQTAGYQPLHHFEAIAPIIGNWYNPATNKWEYGFFEDFAIIEGKRYAYKSVQSTGQEVSISLQQTSTKLAIKLLDSTIVVNGIALQKVNKTLPSYKRSDNIRYPDLQFSKPDSVTIHGYIRNRQSAPELLILVPFIYKSDNGNHHTYLDSSGYFETKVPLQNASDVVIRYNWHGISTVLIPGEKIFVFYDLATRETIFYGDNAQLHNELAAYSQFSNTRGTTLEAMKVQEYHERTLKDTAFLRYKLTELDSLTTIDKPFFALHPFLSERAAYYIKKKNEVNTVMDLLQKRFALNKGEHFSEPYLNIVKNKFINHLPKPLSLVGNASIALSDYTEYYITDSKDSDNVARSSTILSILIDEGTIEVSGEMKEYAKLNNLKNSKTISDEQEARIKNLEQKDSMLHRRYEDLYHTYNNAIERRFAMELLIYKPYNAYLHSGPKEWSDLHLIKSIFAFLNNNPQEFSSNELNTLKRKLQSDTYKSLLTYENKELKRIAGQTLQYTNHINQGEGFTTANDGAKLLADILSPHQGKVVYIDFWGVWCGPCMYEMGYLPALKKELEEKDIIFICFANNTSQGALEHLLKTKNLEGKNVFHYNLPREQQYLLESHYGVMSFPRYMLVNKNGELVNPTAPRPSEKAKLIAEINKLSIQ